MGSKSTKTTTKNVSEPWKAAQPALRDILGQAGGVYGGLGDPYRFVPQMEAALDPARGIASGQYGIGTGEDYQALLSRAMAPGAAEQYLTGMAGGPDINPYFRQMLDDQLARIGAQVNRSVSGVGRYGSGGHAGVLADRLGQAATGALGSEWARAQQQQMAAAQALEQAQQGRLGLQGSAIQGLTGTQAQNLANALVGGQQWLSGIGAMQGAPWTDLRNYASIVAPIGGMGGTSTGTTTQPGPSTGQQIAGTALTLLSFL